MNRRLEQLLKLLELKEELTLKAYHAAVKIKAQIEQHQAKIEQLTGYKIEYGEQIGRLGQEGVPVYKVRNRIDFMGQIDSAIGQIKAAVFNLEKAKVSADVAYKEAKISEEGVKKLIARVRKLEDIKQQRLEQKEVDEFAQKQWRRKNLNNP